jgi:hypothetical protein
MILFDPSVYHRWLQEDGSSNNGTNDSTNTTTSDNNNSTNDIDDSSGSGTMSDGEVLRTTFTIYGSILLIAFLMFCWLRKQYPRAYTIRRWVTTTPIKVSI